MPDRQPTLNSKQQVLGAGNPNQRLQFKGDAGTDYIAHNSSKLHANGSWETNVEQVSCVFVVFRLKKKFRRIAWSLQLRFAFYIFLCGYCGAQLPEPIEHWSFHNSLPKSCVNMHWISVGIQRWNLITNYLFFLLIQYSLLLLFTLFSTSLLSVIIHNS